MTAWPEHAVWWHVYPLGFTGAEREALPPEAAPVHRLSHIEGWLDYVLELGANGLLLGPVFASQTHGYDTVDHHRVDPRLGDEDDLRHLITTCRDRGIRVLLDGVFNHVGRGFAPFRDVLEHGHDSRHAGWFHLYGQGHGDDLDYEHFEGHRHLVTLNHDNPEVVAYVVDVMDHWLQAGIDGWRLDAAYAVPTSFWRDVLARVRDAHPDAWFLGEVIHAPYEPWIHEAGFDTVTQYELWKSIWSSLNDRNFHELAWTLDRHAALTQACLPQTFVGNHDVTRIATQLADDRHVDLAATLLLTLPGSPSIYAGDEQAFTGHKEETPTGDDAVRPTFPSGPDELLPYGWDTYHHHQRLIGLRRRHPGVATGRLHVLDLDNEFLSYVVEGGDDRVVVLLNVSDHERRFDRAAANLPVPVRTEPTSGSAEDDPWRVAPHSWSVVTPDA